MARLFGRDYSRAELLQHVGDISQIARVKPYRLTDGFEDGVVAVDLTTGGGLEFTALASRGLDISSAAHNGRPLAWRSPTTQKHPSYFDADGLGWLRSFSGGLMVTCGLTQAGAPNIDHGQPLGLHGRCSNTPASELHYSAEWQGDDYILSVSGKMREASVFGENIELTRRIWAKLGENCFHVEDTVENRGFQSAPHMLLYHINVGFPVVAEGTRLLAPSLDVTPRDCEAARDGAHYATMCGPTPGYAERCFFHNMKPADDGTVTAALVNPACGDGFGFYVRYPRAELPCFTEWKMMGQGTYVVGLEPGNCLVLGRAIEREAGRLQHLEPGERRTYHLECGVLQGAEEIAALETTTPPPTNLSC